MTERIRSTTFVANDTTFLWFCLTCRTSGIAASQRLKIRDEVEALHLDNAVSLRLMRYDTDTAKQQARLIAIEVGKLFAEPEKKNVKTYGSPAPKRTK